MASRSFAGTLGSPTSLDRTVGTLAGPVLFLARVRITSRDWSAPGDAACPTTSKASWARLTASVRPAESNRDCAALALSLIHISEPTRRTPIYSSAASDVYKRQAPGDAACPTTSKASWARLTASVRPAESNRDCAALA